MPIETGPRAAEVQKTATVSQLKQAVEMTFSHMPMKGPGKISWRHVWGHFCLSYYGQKLVKDDEFLKDYGIKDGDALHFVRHVSTSYNLIKKRSKEQIEVPGASRIPHVLEEIKREAEEDDCDHLENLKCQRCLNDYQSPIMHRDSTFAHFFRGWLFHSRLGRTEKSGPKVVAYPPSLADGLKFDWLVGLLVGDCHGGLCGCSCKLDDMQTLFTSADPTSHHPSLAEEIEKAASFDLNLTLPVTMMEFLLLKFALEKIYFTPFGNFVDEMDSAVKEKLGSVKDTSEEVKQLEEQSAAVVMAARMETSYALNKMKVTAFAALTDELVRKILFN
ncbi:hypothetical protein Nepgr_000836 [Nepenthes gracilis]|uniref:SNRNP25 ubiquitin-like domain-containing protein n=1 Tax=Nepenthes gracilis TaxID=150966 RepID=A0AAD3RVQ4_NEPGR|nr:hypothetical protein Nepgr_000836 [Nepenthes gracilis]